MLGLMLLSMENRISLIKWLCTVLLFEIKSNNLLFRELIFEGLNVTINRVQPLLLCILWQMMFNIKDKLPEQVMEHKLILNEFKNVFYERRSGIYILRS